MGKLMDLIGALGGRKFIMALGGVVAVILAAKFGIAEEQTTKIVALIASYCVGQGIADGLSKGATATAASPVEEPPPAPPKLP